MACPTSYDDDITQFVAPFALGFYGVAATTVQVANNGYIAIGKNPTGAAGYAPSQLSAIATPKPQAAFPFWDDVYFQVGQSHGIWYQTEGVAPNRSITFEWYGTKYAQRGSYFAHFLVTYYEALPSWVTFEYVSFRPRLSLLPLDDKD